MGGDAPYVVTNESVVFGGESCDFEGQNTDGWRREDKSVDVVVGR